MEGYKWELPVETSVPITILGIGTTGLAVVGHLYALNLRDVHVVVCHDNDALLRASPVPSKILYDAEEGRAEAEQAAKVEMAQFLKSSELTILVTDVSHWVDCHLVSLAMTVCEELAAFTIVAVGLPTLTDQLLREEANNVLARLQRQASSLLIYKQTHLATQQRVYQLGDGIVSLITFCDGFMSQDFATVQNLVTRPGRIAITMGTASGEARSKQALKSVITQLNEQPFDVGMTKRLLVVSASGGEKPELVQEHTAIMKDMLRLLMLEPEMVERGLILDKGLYDRFRLSSLFWMPADTGPIIP